MTLYVEHIASNIKKGCNHQLGPKTLIVGDNGKGKTTIVNALELALCQQVTDLLGKEVVKRPSDLIQLTHDAKIWAACKLSDGRTLEVESKRTKTGASRLKTQGSVQASMPYLEVKGHLTGSPQVARSFLMESQIGNAISKEDVISRLSPSHKKRYESSAKRYDGISSNPLTELKKILGDAKLSLRSLQDEKRTLIKAIDHLGSALQPEPTEKEVEEAKRTLEEAQKELHAVPKGTDSHYLESLRNRCRSEIGELQEGENQAKEMEDWVSKNGIQSFSEKDEEMLVVRSKLLDILQLHEALQSSHCLVCGIAKESAAYFKSRRAALEKETGDLIRAYEISQKLGQLQMNLTIKRTKVTDLIAQIKEAEENTQEIDTEPLQKAVNEAQGRYISLHTTQSEWKRLRLDRGTLRGVEAQIQDVNAYSQALVEISTQLLDNAKSSFVKSVQTYLPPAYQFGLNILENRCEIGFQNGKGLNTALSGAEWVSMILALSAANVDSHKEVVLITPEERAYDPATLSSIMKSLQKSKSQVILTSTILPSEVPEGWTLVEI